MSGVEGKGLRGGAEVEGVEETHGDTIDWPAAGLAFITPYASFRNTESRGGDVEIEYWSTSNRLYCGTGNRAGALAYETPLRTRTCTSALHWRGLRDCTSNSYTCFGLAS